MIELTKMDGRKMLLNEDQIQTVEEAPDTVVRLVSGDKYIVKENSKQIYEKVLAYRKAGGSL